MKLNFENIDYDLPDGDWSITSSSMSLKTRPKRPMGPIVQHIIEIHS